jgi:peroxiredoxin
MTQTNAETPGEAFLRCRDMDASLNERLAAFTQASRRFRPSLQEATDRLVKRLREHGVGEDAPKAGDVMPPFMLSDDNGRLVTLDALLEKGPVAITFHRGHWCPFCRISMKALSDAQRRIAGAAQIVAVMPDRQEYAVELKAHGHGNIPVLTDMDNGYAASLGLAVLVGEEMEREMKSIGVEPGKYQGQEHWSLPIPATFVIGTDRQVRARFVDPDYRKRMAIDDLIAVLTTAN